MPFAVILNAPRRCAKTPFNTKDALADLCMSGTRPSSGSNQSASMRHKAAAAAHISEDPRLLLLLSQRTTTLNRLWPAPVRIPVIICFNDSAHWKHHCRRYGNFKEFNSIYMDPE
eukprot:1622607-Pleurochrysis_carterae.AAC.1